MSLHNKRAAYTAQLDNAESIGANKTIVPALINGITEKKTVKGKVYYSISAICMATSDRFIKQTKKQKKDDDGSGGSDCEEESNGTTLKPGQKFISTSFERDCGDIKQGALVKMAVSTDWFNDHYTFKVSKVMVDDNRSVLTRSVYDRKVVETALARVPTKDNFSPADFAEGTNDKYIVRYFILPLSSGVGTAIFTNVEVQVDPENMERFYSSKVDDPAQYLGINTDTGRDKPYNNFTTVYTLNDESDTKVIMKYAYLPDIWSCFGLTDVTQWKSIAGRLVFFAVDWLVYGYSSHSKIMSIRANMDEDDDDEPKFVYSTGYITKMNVNLIDTAIACGVPLSIDYMVNNYGSDSSYENDHDLTTHPINVGWKVLLKRNKKFIVNITDLTTEQVQSFIKEYQKSDKHNIKFYGIYSVESDAPYEIVAEDAVGREEQLVQSGLKPTVVFAVNKK